jgi:pyruvate ferredoxin oxidoreductase alpha subunit
MLGWARDGTLEPLTFLDLDHAIVDRELARMATDRQSGPSAENILRDKGTAAPAPQ